jgi:hypothetical protein
MSDRINKLDAYIKILSSEGTIEEILPKVQESSHAIGLLGYNIPNTPENYALVIAHVAQLARKEGSIPEKFEILPNPGGACYLCHSGRRSSVSMFGCTICEVCAVSIKNYH